MKHHSLIIGLSVLALQSCTDNLIYTEPDNEAILTGNTYKAAFTESPSADQSFTLSSGSRILLNASGSLQIKNKVLTYIDNQWKAENEFEWTDRMEKTNITALYPVYSDLAYSKENLYKSNLLEDILYVKDEFPTGIPINLHFKHLFSLLTLHLSEKLQNKFQKIEITCPVIISAIEPESAQITLTDNESHTTTITQTSSSGNYSFIIPPAENMTITIDVQTAGKKYTTQLPSKSFIGNQEYTYNLKTSETSPGIVTAEDWIAFSQLINHHNITEYNGKTLNDFGEMVDGVMTYRLLNNIDFEGVDCSNLEHIGVDINKKFEGTFDGQGYVISHLTPKTADGTTGLFGMTGASSTIKNLHLKSCDVTITKKCSTGSGILIGACYGKLIHCSVEDSHIDCQVTSNTGGLVGELRGGTIINCHIQNSEICCKDNSVGSISGTSYGNILNCFSANNTIKSETASQYSGGISGGSGITIKSSTTIINCYVYSNSLISNKPGLFVGDAKNAIIKHCFYSSKANLIGGINSSNNTTDDNCFYNNSDFSDKNGNAVYLLLNEWIKDDAGKLYPNLNFSSWTSAGNVLPAIFSTKE